MDCGYYIAARPLISAEGYPALHHLKVADGPGRPLDRSLRIKLAADVDLHGSLGQEVAQLVRPGSVRKSTDACGRSPTSRAISAAESLGGGWSVSDIPVSKASWSRSRAARSQRDWKRFQRAIPRL